MKGITHFTTGLALATFFPEVVELAAEGSLLPVLGGVGALLPDTFDFKFYRFFQRYDLEIDPGPDPHPQEVAETLVEAMREAYETGRSRHVMAHTVQLGADLWRRYELRFDVDAGEVVVRAGPLVSTAGLPYAGTEPAGALEARVAVGVPLVDTYGEPYVVDAFSGPSFRFQRRGEALEVRFLDWHRSWSHSFLMAAALGGLVALSLGRRAGLVFGLGFAAHVVEDQLGYLGSNLGWPLARQRVAGLGVAHSGEAIPNFLLVWSSLVVLLLNLDRFSSQPRLPAFPYLALTLGLPWLLLGGLYLRQRAARRSPSPEALRAVDSLEEWDGGA
jgi:membrane-bound metal-dependent hydrolase YbcI (DUF457 family)